MRLDNHLDTAETAVFLEVEVNDASDFATTVEVTAVRVGHHRVLRATGPSVPNVLAAVLLAVSDQDDMPSHVYFEWSEKGPGAERAAVPVRRRGRRTAADPRDPAPRRPRPRPAARRPRRRLSAPCSTCGSPHPPTSPTTWSPCSPATRPSATSPCCAARRSNPTGDIVLADVAREATNEHHRPARSPSASPSAAPSTSNPSPPGSPAPASTPNATPPAPAPTPSCGPTSPNAPTRSPSSTGPTCRS